MKKDSLLKQLFYIVIFAIFVLSLEACAPWSLYSTPPMVINTTNNYPDAKMSREPSSLLDARGLPSSYPSKDLEYDGNDKIDNIIDSFYK